MPLRPPVTEADHIKGNLSATIEIVEYGDYQCPHCGRAYPLVQKMLEEVGDKVKFVFRNFPLKKVHPQAHAAAVASEAAALQHKYWPMHDMLFQNQRRLTTTGILEYVTVLQLDIQQFEQDILKAELAEKVDAHFYSGMRSGVNATPTFFINGERFNESWEGEGLLNFIKENYF